MVCFYSQDLTTTHRTCIILFCSFPLIKKELTSAYKATNKPIDVVLSGSFSGWGQESYGWGSWGRGVGVVGLESEGLGLGGLGELGSGVKVERFGVGTVGIRRVEVW